MKILLVAVSLGLCGGLCALGCATPKVKLDEGPREYVATDYDSVLKSWTRDKQFTNVNVMDNVLSVTATYESWDFRWAYVVRYAEDYRLTVDQRHSLLERSLAEARDGHQFYVSLYTQKYKWNDLTAKEPAWIVRLIDDEGTETAPSEIESIRKPGAIELTYFPYTTPWRSAFRVNFPRVRVDGRPTISAAARWFGLRFAGAQGYEELIWELGDNRTALSEPTVRSYQTTARQVRDFGEAFARTKRPPDQSPLLERTSVREHRTAAKTSRSGQSPARWTESTEAYGPSQRRGSAEGAVKPKPEIGGHVQQPPTTLKLIQPAARAVAAR